MCRNAGAGWRRRAAVALGCGSKGFSLKSSFSWLQAQDSSRATGTRRLVRKDVVVVVKTQLEKGGMGD